MTHSHATGPMRARLTWGAALVLCAALLETACNRPSCDGLHAPTLSDSAPHLTYVEMLDSQENNPWGLVFALSFTSTAGQVANGNVLVYTGANAPAVLPLQNAFSSSGLSLSATSGRIAVPLTLSQGGVQDDTIVRLGFQLEDTKRQYSNCYSLDIHIDIGLNTVGGLQVKSRTLWAGACRNAPQRFAPKLVVGRVGAPA